MDKAIKLAAAITRAQMELNHDLDLYKRDREAWNDIGMSEPAQRLAEDTIREAEEELMEIFRYSPATAMTMIYDAKKAADIEIDPMPWGNKKPIVEGDYR